ncbi:MAG: MerR family transcriptional regulator [Candidatus Eisenbacteria bacterium]
MLSPTPDLEISELCERVGIPLRTVRYYIQEGLLPPTQREGAGRGPRYGELHVATLRAIRYLQKQELTLGQIRERLASLTMRGLARLAMLDEHGNDPEAPAVAPVSMMMSMSLPARVAGKSPFPAEPDEKARRTSWERIELSPDIELHVKRPLSPYWNKRLEVLLTMARRILGGDKP